jgi:hypothetical protein
MEEKKLIYCKWLDITSGDDGWKTEEDALDWADTTDSVVRQTGFLLSKDQDYLVLCCSYIPGLELVGTTVRIPIPAIQEYHEIPI